MNQRSQFKEKAEEFRKQQDFPAPKCISDYGLLWLKYGIWKLRNNYDDYDRFAKNRIKNDYFGYSVIITKDTDKRILDELDKRLVKHNQDFETDLLEAYKVLIRGNMDFTNRPMIPTVATLFYLFCLNSGYRITQKDSGEIFGCTESVIRVRCQELRKLLDEYESGRSE